MSFAHGHKAGFSVKDATTTWRNISQYLNSVDFPRTADTAEVTTFNTSTSSKAYVPGNKDATLSLEGKWDPTVDGYLSGILGKQRAFTYYPNTTSSVNTNFVRYSGNAICTAYNPPASVDDAVSFSAEFQVTGTITRSTASS